MAHSTQESVATITRRTCCETEEEDDDNNNDEDEEKVELARARVAFEI